MFYGLNFPKPLGIHSELPGQIVPVLCPLCPFVRLSLRFRSLMLDLRRQFRHPLAKIPLAHDGVAVENLPGLVPAQFHGRSLAYASSDQIADRRPPKVVETAEPLVEVMARNRSWCLLTKRFTAIQIGEIRPWVVNRAVACLTPPPPAVRASTACRRGRIDSETTRTSC